MKYIFAYPLLLNDLKESIMNCTTLHINPPINKVNSKIFRRDSITAQFLKTFPPFLFLLRDSEPSPISVLL